MKLWWTPYSPSENRDIEAAFAAGAESLAVPTCFNAVVHFNRAAGGHHHQLTPAVGSKPAGFRSVLRGACGAVATTVSIVTFCPRAEVPTSELSTELSTRCDELLLFAADAERRVAASGATARGRSVAAQTATTASGAATSASQRDRDGGLGRSVRSGPATAP